MNFPCVLGMSCKKEIEHEDTAKRKLHELIPFDVERILVKTFSVRRIQILGPFFELVLPKTFSN